MIGPYRIEREIARGGMGIVYLARDTRLERTVALKSLPPEVAGDPERLERFEREAKLLASLNHPNIGAIYDVVESEGRRYLALEHVDGETLGQRLSSGALPLAEALEVCLQIASGMEAAHERGVIHRDLKPWNVMITPGDQVKIVDFGLAKGAVAPDSSTVDSPTVSASSPTITSPAIQAGTIPGVILGTAPYLSPEQARGKAVDRRTDIWSWGCTLYECLTGRMAFRGDTVTDTIASILKQDPDWSLLPKATPERIRELIEHCLEKDPRRRLRDIGDARVELERTLGVMRASPRVRAPAGHDGRRIERPSLRGAVTLVVPLLAAAAGVFLGQRTAPTPTPAVTRFTLSFPAHLEVWWWALAPDGSALVLKASERGGDSTVEARSSRLYLRRFDRFDVQALPGTENTYGLPVVSQDSRQVLFVTATSYASVNRTLVRVALDGGSPAVTLARWDPEWETMAPLPGGDVLVLSHQGRFLVRIPATGGAPVSLGPILCADSAASFRLVPGRCVIDDRTMLLQCNISDSLGYHVGIAVLDLSSRRVRIVLRDGENPVISPTGHLLFMLGDALFGLRCDSHGVPRGAAVGLIEEVRTPGYGITLSSSGTLVYRPGGRVAERRRLVIAERDGKIVPWSDDRKVFVGAHALSRDGGRAAIEVVNEHKLGEIWIADLQRHELSRTLTAAAADLNYPCLSPDGSLIVYRRVSTDSSNGIYLQRTDGMGSPVRLLSPRPDQMLRYYPLGWSADGSTLYLDRWIGSRAGLARIRVAPTRDTVVQDLFRRQDSQAMGGMPSPNGRWLAFQWDQTGRAKVYVAELHSDGSLGEPRRLSYRDAAAPRWSADGRTIYWNEAGNWVATPFEPTSGQISDQPRVVLDRQSKTKDLAVLPDGRLFAIQGSEEETNSISELNVVLHWTHELEEKMGGATR